MRSPEVLIGTISNQICCQHMGRGEASRTAWPATAPAGCRACQSGSAAFAPFEPRMLGALPAPATRALASGPRDRNDASSAHATDRPRHRDELRRDRRGGRAARRGRTRRNPLRHRAQPDRGACGVRRRGAGDRRARACRGARRRDPRGDDAMPATTWRRSRRRRGHRRAGPDRRAPGRHDDGARHRGGAQAAAPAAQPSGGPRADRDADRRAAPSPICCCSSPAAIRSSSRSKASAAIAGSARRSTTRSAKPSTRPRSFSASPIPAGRMSSARRVTGDPRRFPLPRPLNGAPGCGFLVLRTEDGAAPRGRGSTRRSRRHATSRTSAPRSRRRPPTWSRTARAPRSTSSATTIGRAPTALVVAGGVAANETIRARLTRALRRDRHRPSSRRRQISAPTTRAMIAWAGAERLAAGLATDPDLPGPRALAARRRRRAARRRRPKRGARA